MNQSNTSPVDPSQRVAIGNSLFLRGPTLFITRLDVIKACALVIMIIDHIGHFFFADDLMWRAVGRIGLPVWFFMAGYSRPKRWLDPHLVIGGIVLSVAYVLTMDRLWPQNALISILLVHGQTLCFLSVKPQWDRLTHVVKIACLIIYAAVLCVLTPVSSLFWEYGSLALLMGVCGLLKRDSSGLSAMVVTLCTVALTYLVIAFQISIFQFTGATAIVSSLGIAALMAVLYLADLRHVYTGHQSSLLRLMGRYTLEFYVGHLLLFMAIYYFLHI